MIDQLFKIIGSSYSGGQTPNFIVYNRNNVAQEKIISKGSDSDLEETTNNDYAKAVEYQSLVLIPEIFM
ncbi:20481_t:CDS:2 [Entrophospora sp. SA101]|nr:20481_t:CDS:2 [Entrophospora sp. SA101]